MRGIVLLVALVCWTSAEYGQNCARPQDVVLAPVNIVDVERRTVRYSRALFLSGGRIVRESASTRVPGSRWRRAALINGYDAYVIPGLWDMHVHALWDTSVPQPFFQMFLANGITAVRDMGGDVDVALATRARINACEIKGPHMWFAGPFLDGPQPVDPSLSIALSSPSDARSAVRMLRRQRVDFIKVYSLVPADVFAAIVDEASKRGLRAAGHLPVEVPPNSPFALRMASIEHLAIETGGYCPANNRAACAPIFDALVRAHVAQTPTLIVRETSTQIATDVFREPQSLQAMPEVVRSYWRTQRQHAMSRATKEWRAERVISLAHARWMTGELSKRGAIVLAGTDAGTPYVIPGKSLHDELALLVEAGLSPLEALRAATLEPARFMNRRDMGVIAPGAVADFVLLSANPLENIHNTRTISGVFMGGAPVARGTE